MKRAVGVVLFVFIFLSLWAAISQFRLFDKALEAYVFKGETFKFFDGVVQVNLVTLHEAIRPASRRRLFIHVF